MLFVDHDFISSTDMVALDSEVQRVASASSITLDGEGGVCRQAIQECGNAILAETQSYTGGVVPSGINSLHVAAVQNVGSYALNRPSLFLNQVVAIDPDPNRRSFKQWVLYSAMEYFYRMAFRQKVDDRFEKKFDLWKKDAGRAFGDLRAVGIPVVMTPLAAPGAIREYQAGTFSAANNVSVTGTAATQVAYDVSITWVDSSVYTAAGTPNNGESAPSLTVQCIASAGQTITVSIANLTGPNGVMPPALGVANGAYTPGNATGWNVYIGLSGQTQYLQTTTPTAYATKTKAITVNSLLSSGVPAGLGQASLQNFAFQRMRMRG